MYICNFYCASGHKVYRAYHVKRERHPIAFPVDGPPCPKCNRAMTLAGFTQPNYLVIRPQRKIVVRRPIRKGQFSLFPDYQG